MMYHSFLLLIILLFRVVSIISYFVVQCPSDLKLDFRLTAVEFCLAPHICIQPETFLVKLFHQRLWADQVSDDISSCTLH